MKITDHNIATIIWIITVIAVALFPTWIPMVQFGIICAATANLLHARYVMYNAGQKFAIRVREVLADDLVAINHRMAECERKVEDVKESQINIAGQFRGASNTRAFHP